MNKEVIKAINKTETKISKFCKWWNKNEYKVMRVVLFPVWLGVKAKEKINSYLNSRQVWSEERVNEILNYYVPRYADWDIEEKEFYFFDNGYGWNITQAKRYLKIKDRRFWKVHSGFNGGKIRKYLINNFELEGFTKELGHCSNGYTEIIFKMTEK